MANTDGKTLDELYVQQLITEAKKKYKADTDPLFDPQRAYISDIKNSAITCPQDINQQQWEQYVSAKKTFTTVSLDVLHLNENEQNSNLNSKFTEHENMLKSNNGSINPIFREVFFHLRGVLNIYQKNTTIFIDTLTVAYNDAMRETNKKIMNEYNKILIKYENETDPVIKLQKINIALDEYRKISQKLAYDTFTNKLSTSNTNTITKAQAKKIKGALKQTVGSGNDLLHVSGPVVMFASGNEHSSHNKEFGAEPALVKINYYSLDNNTITTPDQKHHYTVPSFVKKHSTLYFINISNFQKKYIDDAKNKITQIVTRLKNDRVQKETPIIYNLYTSLNTKSILGYIDERSNKQSQSAKYILLGAHAYNKDNKDNKDKSFFYVQNIPVNGHGYPLSYGINPLVNEATLMTEMSLMMTLAETKDKNAPQQKYNDFLTSSTGSEYFSSSIHNPRGLINVIKSKIKSTAPVSTEDFKENSKNCLKLLMAHDCHFRNDAILFQALSVFVEPASVSGCKSSIDRTPMVENRITVLNDILTNPSTDQELLTDIKIKIKAIANLTLPDRANPTKVKQLELELEQALNKATNELEAQSSATMVANARIGGAAKYQARLKVLWKTMTMNPLTWPIIGHINNFFRNLSTNRADSSSMTSVSHENPGQLHGKDAKKNIKKSTAEMIQAGVASTTPSNATPNTNNVASTQMYNKLSDNDVETNSHVDIDERVSISEHQNNR